MKRYLIFLPSLGLGFIALVWLYFVPFPYTREVSWPKLLLVTVSLLCGLLASAFVLEKTLVSFRQASQLFERALAHFKLSLPFVFGLAALSALAEELFFRAALMPLIGVWGQALVFGLMHPAPKRAWSYTVFTGFAGLLFGYATLYTGSLLPAIAAHFFINLQGFLELRAKQHKRLRS